MMSSVVWRSAFIAVSFGLLGISRVGSAQAPLIPDVASEGETRAQLEAEAKKAEEQHRTSEAWILRTRLQKGDFQDGDRIIVKVLGTAGMTNMMPANDTVTLRAGKLLPLPQMGEVPLDGVLRSELTEKLSAHIGKFLQDSRVRVTPLVRMAVLGQVRVPGYLYTPADALLSDVVMKAGGPLPTADVGNMVIRRDGKIIWNAQDTRTALSDGLTVDRLHLRAGDELYVDDIKGGIPWGAIFQVVGPLLTVVYGIYRVSH